MSDEMAHVRRKLELLAEIEARGYGAGLDADHLRDGAITRLRALGVPVEQADPIAMYILALWRLAVQQ